MLLSKERKVELFVFTLLSIIILSSFVNFRSLHAKFYNKTGENIDSLVIGETLIGNIKNGSSTESINFKEFVFDGSEPYEQISGIINNKKVSQLNWSWCGTERNKQSKGSYIFDLKKEIDDKGNTCLYLVKHNQKMFWE
ncbi:hypothetical protein [Flavobacterium piscis]|uniref:DUF4430 domain-containing protein n=1 Tax=Flavobacterium piscis TaxID=1114874 RepID=A0ABU1Y283_9FLAO|nr:hypothetical protein [Flavobacterium piscis]MDR7208340.1 hypothetical protein [Flavobacterium piscis]